MNKQHQPLIFGKSLKMTNNSFTTMNKTIKTKLDKLAKLGCINMVFTRFPYYNTPRKNSKTLSKTVKEGNCVAFAYYMKECLRINNIKSYIVGAKPPPNFAREGYNEISHSAVVAPYSDGYILFDTSFYFDKAIILNKLNNFSYTNTFKNVYSEMNDEWNFKIINDRINVKINNVEVNAYYELRELKNPESSITYHTNLADKTIFRCEIDKKLSYEFVYKINLNNDSNTLILYSKKQPQVLIYLKTFYKNNKYTSALLKHFLDTLDIIKSQKLKAFDDINTFILKYYPLIL
jgi:hypothetical protein